MRLPTVSKSAAALSVAAALFLAAVPSSAQMSQSNPLQYVEIETGHKNINDQIKKQTKAQEKTGLLQATISAEFTKIKQWEGKYNSYLKTARGYAEAIKAGTSLYAEGVETLRHIHEIRKAVAANPQGIGASVAMNNIYVETAAELIRTYRLLKVSVALGTNVNMLTGAERTELLWNLNDALDQLNRKLRRLAMSIAFYNLGDVWNNATAGMVERSHAQVAADAIDRWKRAQRVYAILDD
ncbi:MAG: hypothetical protein IKH35_04715 [Prevotella sp.]|nr:hypothetical protein [Prevotella sp.]